MYCEKCGVKNDDAVAFCSGCNNPFKSQGTSSGAAGIAEGAADKVKAASQDAWKSFRLFATNPVEGLPAAFESLGGARAFGVGITFGVVFAVFSAVALSSLLSQLVGSGIASKIKMLLVSFVPFISLSGASFISRMASKGDGSIGHDCFIGGAALLPLGFLALASTILGIGNIELILFFAVVAICLNILMLFSGLTRIYKISEKIATIAVPSMLIISAWLSKVIYSMLSNY
jgi:hypothetical protein